MFNYNLGETRKIMETKGCKRYILAIFFLAMTIGSFAQQDPMYTQYMNNPLTVNPAFAGSREISSLTGVFRKQWVGIDGAPTTSAITYNSLVKKYNCGVGASLIYDEIGPVSQTGVYLDYAYHIRFDEKGTLALGLKGGFNHYYVNYSGLYYSETDDDLNNLENESLMLWNFGIGSYYYTDKLYLGLSIPKLIRNSLEEGVSTNEALSREDWHVFLMGGYIFNLTENIDLKPSVITRYAVGSPLSIDLNATFMLYDKIWLGAMYRLGGSFGGQIRWQITPKLHVGYSYDLIYSEFKGYNTGTHEIFIGIDFIKKNQFDAIKRFF